MQLVPKSLRMANMYIQVFIIYSKVRFQKQILPHSNTSFTCVTHLCRMYFAHPYQLDQSISNFRVVLWIFFIFIQIIKDTFVTKQWRPDKMRHFAVPDLVLHCLLMSYKKDARLIWVKLTMALQCFSFLPRNYLKE